MKDLPPGAKLIDAGPIKELPADAVLLEDEPFADWMPGDEPEAPDMDQAEGYARAYGARPENEMAPVKPTLANPRSIVPMPGDEDPGYVSENPYVRAVQGGAADVRATVNKLDAVAYNRDIAKIKKYIALYNKTNRTPAEQKRYLKLHDRAQQWQARFGVDIGNIASTFKEESAQKAAAKKVWDAWRADDSAAKNYPFTKKTQAFLGAKTWGEAWNRFSSDPVSIGLEVFSRSAPAMAPGLAAGAVNPALGAAVFGGTTFTMGSMGALREELEKAGVDVNDPMAVKEALQTDIGKRALTRAQVSALPAAALDTVAAGVASKVIGGPVRNFLTQTATQMGTGAAGDAGQQLIQHGKIVAPGSVMAEAVVEGISTPGDVAAMGFQTRRNIRKKRAEKLAAELKEDHAKAVAGELFPATEDFNPADPTFSGIMNQIRGETPLEGASGLPPKAFKSRVLEQAAWHGTHAKGIDRFSTDFIGTGEGSQVRGWGLYFAEVRDTGVKYREIATRRQGKGARAEDTVTIDGAPIDWDSLSGSEKFWTDLIVNIYTMESERADANRSRGQPARDVTLDLIIAEQINDTLELIERDSGSKRRSVRRDVELRKERVAYLEQLRGRMKATIPGALYNLEITANPRSEFIHLDNSFADQPQIVQDYFQKNHPEIVSQVLEDESRPGAGHRYKTGRYPSGNKMYDMLSAKLAEQGLSWWAPRPNRREADMAASLELLKNGIKGNMFEDKFSRGTENPTHNFVVFDGDLIKIVQEFEQSQGGQPPRGRIRVGDGIAVIELSATRDASTFMHESAHFFLASLERLAADGNPAALNRLAATKKWLKLSGDQEITNKHHEKFARAFEAYLRKGKAPNSYLQQAFDLFARLLQKIYATLKVLNVDLSKAAIKDFDRLLGGDTVPSPNALAFAEMIENRLLALGYPPDDARANAAVWAGFAEQLQNEFDLDPAKFIGEKMGLDIVAAEQLPANATGSDVVVPRGNAPVSPVDTVGTPVEGSGGGRGGQPPQGPTPPSQGADGGGRGSLWDLWYEAQKKYDAHMQRAMNWFGEKFFWWGGEMPGLKDGKMFRIQRQRALGYLHMIDKAAEKLFKRINAFSAADKEGLYGYLTTRIDPSVIKNPEVRALGEEIKQTFNDLGDALVDAGLLTEETVAHWRGKYLPRMYLMHMAGIKEGTSAADVYGHLKQRKDIPEDVRRAMGEITDPALPAAVGMNQSMRSIVMLNLFNEIAKNPNWAIQEGFVHYDGSRVGLGMHLRHLSQLRDRLRRMGNAELAEEVNESMRPFMRDWEHVKRDIGSPDGITQNTSRITAEEIQAHKQFLREVAKAVQPAPEQRGATTPGDPGIAGVEEIQKGIASAIDALAYVGPQAIGTFAAADRAKALRRGADSATDPDVREDMLNMARILEHRLDQTESPQNHRSYVQIPDEKKYGDLRGMYVHRTIHEQIMGDIEFMSPDVQYWGPLWRTVEKGVKYWKVGKVPTNPGTVARNIMSNAILLNLSGVNMADLPARLTEAANDYFRKGETYKIAQRWGVGGGTFSAAEMVQMRKAWVRAQENAEKGQHPMQFVFGLMKDGAGAFSAAYGEIEVIFKMAKIIDAKKKGLDDANAVYEAQKWLFDYGLMPGWGKKVRNSVLPFFTFTYKVLPRLAEAAVLRPFTMAGWMTLLYKLVPMMWAYAFDMDEDEYWKVKDTMAPFVRGNPGAIILPWKDSHGRWQPLDMSYITPWGFLANAGNKLLKGELIGALGEAGVLSFSPVLTTTAAAITGIDPFTKREVTADNLFQFLWNQTMPGYFTEYGGGGKWLDYFQGTVNPYTGGPKLDLGQTAVRTGGLNIYPSNSVEGRRWNIAVMGRELRELKSDFSRAMRNKNNTMEDRRQLRKKYIPKIRELRRKIREYQKRTKDAARYDRQ